MNKKERKEKTEKQIEYNFCWIIYVSKLYFFDVYVSDCVFIVDIGFQCLDNVGCLVELCNPGTLNLLHGVERTLSNPEINSTTNSMEATHSGWPKKSNYYN